MIDQAAQCFSLVSMGLIMLSVGTFIAETMPEFRADLKKVRLRILPPSSA